MDQPRPHILVDLTAAFGTSAGIPQSARQTAWLLARAPHWRTSALALSLHEQGRASVLGRAHSRAQAIGTEAEYLSSLIDPTQKRPSSLAGEVAYELKRRLFPSYPLIPFTPGNWGEVLWEHYFAPGFPSSLRQEVKKIPFYRSPLTRPEATLARRDGVPAPRLDTRGIDVVIFQNPTPIRVSRGTRKIIRCHDLVPLLRFDTQPQDSQLIRDYRLALAQCVEDSHFACVSEATREALLDFYPALRPRSCVIPNSVPVFEWMDERAPEPGAPHAYFLAVGTIEPRKNYLRLLRGFRLYLEGRPRVNKLVLVGGRGWRNAEEVREIERCVAEGWLTWHERLDADVLVEFYRNAHALVGASIDEGFGLPPLEAAALGTPSVLSDLGVFRTHFGDAAEYFDAYDLEALAAALGRMTPERRAGLSARVRTLAGRFSPENECAHWQELIRDLTRCAAIPRAAPVRITSWKPREETAALPLSIVLAAERVEEHLASALERLVPQAKAAGAEIFVGLCEPCATPERWPLVRFFTDPAADVAGLRAQGAAQARGEIIAFTDEHAVVPADWCERLRREHRAHPEAAVIFGPVRQGGPGKITAWANFYARFGLFLPPLDFPPAGRTPPLLNVSIKRAWVPEGSWKRGWFESTGLPTLYDFGLCRVAPDLMVEHVEDEGWFGIYSTHYRNGRITTGSLSLARGSAAWRAQLGDSLDGPLRSVFIDGPEIWRSGEPRGRLLLAFPAYVLIALAQAAGEIAGLFFGPGRTPFQGHQG
jgi:glycosyltransferase involved in cell wall biosynthesis